MNLKLSLLNKFRLFKDSPLLKEESAEQVDEREYTVEELASYEITGKLFVITGKLTCGLTKYQVHEIIRGYGGYFRSSMTNQVHCLIVGGSGSANYATKHGNKYDKAREIGADIISEEALLMSMYRIDQFLRVSQPMRNKCINYVTSQL